MYPLKNIRNILTDETNSQLSESLFSVWQLVYNLILTVSFFHMYEKLHENYVETVRRICIVTTKIMA